MSSAKKYAVGDGPQPKRRVKRCSPISVWEIMFCDWDYEVDDDDDDVKTQAREAFVEANGEGSESDSPRTADRCSAAGAAPRPSGERKSRTGAARSEGGFERAEAEEEEGQDDEDEGSRMGESFSRLRDSMATKHTSPLRKTGATDKNAKLPKDQSTTSVLNIDHVGEEGEEEESAGEGTDTGSVDDWREGERPTSLEVPRSPPGMFPAREEDGAGYRDRSQREQESESEREREPERAGAAPLPGAVNEDFYDEISTTRARREDDHDTENDAEEEMTTSAAAAAIERSVNEVGSASQTPQTPEYGAGAVADRDRDSGLTPAKALKKLMGEGAGDAHSHSYLEVRRGLGVEEELERPLDEVLAPVDVMSSFLSRRYNLFTPYMNMMNTMWCR